MLERRDRPLLSALDLARRVEASHITPEGMVDLCAAAIAARISGEGFVWVGMVEPRPDELEEVRELFGLHELAVEDAQSFHLRPKFEQYDDVWLPFFAPAAST